MSTPHVWPYAEYSEWSRMLAANHTRAELEKKAGKANGSLIKTRESHFQAVHKTSSMGSHSSLRAHSRNAMVNDYETRQACLHALEIYDLYPEHTKEGRAV